MFFEYGNYFNVRAALEHHQLLLQEAGNDRRIRMIWKSKPGLPPIRSVQHWLGSKLISLGNRLLLLGKSSSDERELAASDACC